MSLSVGMRVYVAEYGDGRITEYLDYPDGYMWKVRLDDGREVNVHDDQIVSAA